MLKRNDSGVRADDSGSLIIMPFDQYLVNIGELFSCSDYVASAATNNRWLIHIPSGVTTHIKLRIISANKAQINVYKGTTASANGSSINVYNMNNRFQGTKTPSTSIYSGPTISDNGTIIESNFAGAGRVGMAFGGIARSESERVIGPDDYYLVNVIPETTGAELDMYYTFYEYEE